MLDYLLSLIPALTRIPCGLVFQCLAESEAFSVAPAVINLPPYVAMGANYNLLAWGIKMKKKVD